MKRLNHFLSEAQKKSELTLPNRELFIPGGLTPSRNDMAMASFGRMNPMTEKGHGTFLQRLMEEAKEKGIAPEHTFPFASRTQDFKKNPLDPDYKIESLNKYFGHGGALGKQGLVFPNNPNIKTYLQALKSINDAGFQNANLFVGDDRKDMMDVARKYNGDLYNFRNLEFSKFPHRDENAISGTKMREFARNNDYKNFRKNLRPNKNFSEEDLGTFFDKVRLGMRLPILHRNEYDLRDAYKKGEIFLEGDIVESKTTLLTGRIHRRGANHVICVSEDGVMWRSFITDIDTIYK